MSYELIISEKPQAATKIAQALSDKTLHKKRENNVNYYELTHDNKEIRVASAVGHLYSLGEKGGESWEYPVFETQWKPTYKISKASAYTKDYIKLLEKLGKKANEITIASDFDIEGEVIGLNIVRFTLGKKDANRMKFSTLTKDELIKAYKNKQKHLEWGQAKAGDTRHHLDWYYGINLSRAFTTSIKKATNRFKVLSTGRVQAPTLHFLAEREKKISKFKPESYSEIYLNGHAQKTKIQAQYELPLDLAKKQSKGRLKQNEEEEEKKSIERGKIFDLEFSKKVVKETTSKNGIITDISSKQFKQKVPFPFDLTSLQMEASNQLGLSPKRTLEIAQKLYIEGVTSYPRTSSQKLPKELDLKDKLKKLSKQHKYKEKVDLVFEVNPNIQPNEGIKTDPAHPAIHPTGEIPKSLQGQEAKVYDLIVKRFFAIFGKEATRETQTITIEINSHTFVLKGTRTIDPQWHLLYEPYLKFDNITLPQLDKGTTIENEKIEEILKETAPPKRYTDASIIKELEKRNLGTKATRAEILEQLRLRGYIIDKSIKVTELGLKMDNVMTAEVPALVDETMTNHFEEEMKKIREEKVEPQTILNEAKENLGKILKDIKSKEINLGKKLSEASKLAAFNQSKIAPCPVCKVGTLVVKTAKKSRQKFIACDKYPECKTIFKAPQNPIIKEVEGEPVDKDGKIWILTGKSEGGRLQKVCINDETAKEEEKEIGHKMFKEEGMTCPVCKEGKMVLRKSFYGEFLGCNKYPECKTMMKIHQGKVDTTPISPSTGKENFKNKKGSKTTKTTKPSPSKTTKKVVKKK